MPLLVAKYMLCTNIVSVSFEFVANIHSCQLAHTVPKANQQSTQELSDVMYSTLQFEFV
jgi:hypothetical protein